MNLAKSTSSSAPGPAQYYFSLAPSRWFGKLTHCPACEQLLAERKLPFLIKIEPNIITVFSVESHYCPACDWLMLEQRQFESLLAAFCLRQKLYSVIGHDYEVTGTVEEEAWQRGMEQGMEIEQLQPYVHPFKEIRPFKQARQGLKLTTEPLAKKAYPAQSKHLSLRQRKKGQQK